MTEEKEYLTLWEKIVVVYKRRRAGACIKHGLFRPYYKAFFGCDKCNEESQKRFDTRRERRRLQAVKLMKHGKLW